MRVLFVDTLVARLNFQPLGLLSLAAVCKQAGHRVLLADGTVRQQVADAVDRFEPDVVGFTATTGMHRRVLELCRQLKERASFHSVLGGPHATFYSEVAAAPELDAVCRGEAERSFVEYLQRLQSGDQPGQTPNFVFGSSDRLVENPPLALIDDLDSLPFGAWEILDDHPIASRFPIKPFMASRGCPFRCTFCHNKALHRYYQGKGPLIRRFSPARFVAEVKAYKQRAPLTFVYIFDDVFATDPDWLDEFSDLYAAEIGLPFFVNLTARLVTSERIDLLKQAGLAYLAIGLEAGNEQIRREVIKKPDTDRDLENAASVLHRARVPFALNNVLAIPGTTLDHDLETLSMNIALQPDFSEAMIFQPYPGTPLGEQAKELGLYSGDPDQIPESYKSRTILNIEHGPRVRRLLFLFQFLVALRTSNRLAAWLVGLPLTPAYWLINRLYEGLTKSRRIYKIKISPLDRFRILYRYLRT